MPTRIDCRKRHEGRQAATHLRDAKLCVVKLAAATSAACEQHFFSRVVLCVCADNHLKGTRDDNALNSQLYYTRVVFSAL